MTVVNIRWFMRLLRKRLVLAIIFCLSFTYFIVNVFRIRMPTNDDYDDGVDIDHIKTKLINLRRGQTFHNLQTANHIVDSEKKSDFVVDRKHDANESQFALDFKFDSLQKSETCRNSVQGKVLIADDKGYVCNRKDLTVGGCCDKSQPTTKLYSCDTCLEHGCCAIYEYCISCCMEPGKQPLLQKIISRSDHGAPLGGAASVDVLFASITDHFEFCLAKCRTSSQSVQHENSYRDPKAKHCYGEIILNPSPIVKTDDASKVHSHD
ncbi:hypothetical protein B4U79_11551 [Dinothrombium tinctorium]|uniref:SREBP regulating gene protein n=1 Tax=Dinothrombium tinctorium TaxID=1965070 RepID=A0A3S4R4M0_9ACAR|nr:hypothetical protein B4U79_11551 [Dinothrombium tinctorium]